MVTATNSVVDQVQQLLAEEAHLIGQELQDSLTKKESRRLAQLASELDELAQLLDRRHHHVGS